MRAFLLTALWIHLASSALLVGAFFMALLAGWPDTPTARRWDRLVVTRARLLALVAIASGIVWLLVRTAVFENRAHAALEPRAAWHAVIDTWPGLVWLTRHALLIMLVAFLALRANVTERWNWIAARGEALLLASLALALVSGASHAAAISPGTARAVASDITHLLGTGLWLGGLVALALLLRATGPHAEAETYRYTVLAARRFSRAALIVVAVLVASGAINALAQVESVAALAGTTHGRLLLAKLAVLVPILVLAVVNRTHILPALPATDAMRRLARFVGLEAVLVLVLLGLAAAMTLTTPARHDQPIWPFPFRLSLDIVFDTPSARWRALLGAQLAVVGLVVLVGAVILHRRRSPVIAGAVALITLGAGIGLPPLVVDAYPTSYRRPLLPYHAASIAAGMAVYGERCASCHGLTGGGDGTAMQGLTDLRSPPTSRRHAGEIFWLLSHGIPGRGMPRFDDRLAERQRWDVINFIRALGAAGDSRRVGARVEPDRAWLVAPDFVVSVGPLAPGTLRDYRGRRMVLLVLYTLPGSRARMTELARIYDVLWIMGVEVVAVPTHASANAIAQLGSSPAVLFPVVTEGTDAIVATYRMFARGPHAELLIDRQGYIRAIWRGEAARVQPEVEKLNAEKSPPPFPDDHVH